jgi:hypothetical protein
MTATANSVNRLFSSVASMTDAPKLGGGKKLWVDAIRGDDATAQRGRKELPFKTCGLAKVLGLSGDTVVVQAGAYNENDLAKDGLNWHFEAGASVDYSIAVSDVTVIKGIFDTPGASYRITGWGRFSLAVNESGDGVGGGGEDIAIVNMTTGNVTVFADVLPSAQDNRSNAGSTHAIYHQGGTLAAHVVNLGGCDSVSGTADIGAEIIGGLSCSGAVQTTNCGRFTAAICSAGTQSVVAASAGTITRTGGTQTITAPTATSISNLQNAGTGSATYNIGSIVGTGANVVQNNTPLAVRSVYNVRHVEGTVAPVCELVQGTIEWSDGRIICTGATGADSVVQLGNAVTPALKADFTNVIIVGASITHAINLASGTDVSGIRVRLFGCHGISATNSLGSHHPFTYLLYGVNTFNQPVFATTVAAGGSGGLILDPALAA